ncbi:DUF1799 domain-containing protein [Candidatus Thiothrix sp. Deng01]|uniref:DUF1799 domain-containing protein n=1 Tax=Candidatus Thiothrix phosphatis TaxID=3112415 RepID=A0ABU6CVF2_9GAMM|nr:DUF1799 domain-containing protein [Candidatus Thiothrix sp. Deng01]MEB4590028.1 DUF1799 domain-containing protein [Candidatus Thiothrix sp. Deng01]
MDCNWKLRRTRKPALGKLIDSGYLWAGGGDANVVDFEIIRELRELGLHEQADALSGESQQNIHHVWPENWQAWECFYVLSDQWIIAPMGGVIGLNGVAIMQYLGMSGVVGNDAMNIYSDVRLIASGAIKAWRENAKA